MAQKFSAVARSLTRTPSFGPKRGASVRDLPSVRILKTVAMDEVMVHSVRARPASSHWGPSVCFTGANNTRDQASSTAGFTASLTRVSTALTAPSEMSMPSTSPRSLTAERRFRW